MHAFGHDGRLICGHRLRVRRGAWGDGGAEAVGEDVIEQGRLRVRVGIEVVLGGVIVVAEPEEVVFEAGREGEFFVEGRWVCGQGVEECGERAEAMWTDHRIGGGVQETDGVECGVEAVALCGWGVARGWHWGVVEIPGTQGGGSKRRAGRDEWRGEGNGAVSVAGISAETTGGNCVLEVEEGVGASAILRGEHDAHAARTRRRARWSWERL